jgi:hypothetical protein
VLLIGGPIAEIGAAPSMFPDRVEVDKSGFSRRSGFWGMMSNQKVAFADLNQIRRISEESRGRRGRRQTNYYLMCDTKAGPSIKVPLGNDVVEAAAPTMLQNASAVGANIVDQMGETSG